MNGASGDDDLSMTEQARDAVQSLVEDGTLTQEQADQVLARLRVTGPAPGRSVLVEFAGYLGGALLLGGVSLIVVPTWDDLAFGARLAIAVAMTVLLAAAALGIGGPWRPRPAGGSPATGTAGPSGSGATDGGSAAAAGSSVARATDGGTPRRRVAANAARLASTLGALAAGGAATVAAVLSPDRLEFLLASSAALVVTLVLYPLLRGAPLLAAAGLASTLTVFAALERAGVDDQAWWATGFAVLGAAWLAVAMTPAVTERGTAGLVGGAIGLVAGETAATAEPDAVALYGLALGVVFVAAGFGAYLAGRGWPWLVPATLTALVVPATALSNVLENGLVAGVVVAAVGALILAAGGLGLLRRKPA